MGIGTSLIVWIVWHFTKILCLPDNAAGGLCNPNILARFINAEILALAGGAGLAVANTKNCYDHNMMRHLLNQERETRQGFRELIAELRDKRREELKVAA